MKGPAIKRSPDAHCTETGPTEVDVHEPEIALTLNEKNWKKARFQRHRTSSNKKTKGKQP